MTCQPGEGSVWICAFPKCPSQSPEREGSQSNLGLRKILALLQPRYRRLTALRPEVLRPCLSAGLPSNEKFTCQSNRCQLTYSSRVNCVTFHRNCVTYWRQTKWYLTPLQTSDFMLYGQRLSATQSARYSATESIRASRPVCAHTTRSESGISNQFTSSSNPAETASLSCRHQPDRERRNYRHNNRNCRHHGLVNHHRSRFLTTKATRACPYVLSRCAALLPLLADLEHPFSSYPRAPTILQK